MFKRYLAYAALPALLLVGAGCGPQPAAPGQGPSAVGPSAEGPGEGMEKEPTVPARLSSQRVVALREIAGSGVSGYAVLTATDNNETLVTVVLSGYERSAVHGIALHGGTCADPGAPVQYDLDDAANGRSETTLNVNFSSFAGGTPQSIKVRRAPEEPGAPLASCGDIR
jgi:hypothetical protein